MLVPIDAVHYGAGFDTTGRWHEARADELRQEEPSMVVMAPARGAIYGLLVSAVMWLGLLVAARAVLTLIR